MLLSGHCFSGAPGQVSFHSPFFLISWDRPSLCGPGETGPASAPVCWVLPSPLQTTQRIPNPQPAGGRCLGTSPQPSPRTALHGPFPPVYPSALFTHLRAPLNQQLNTAPTKEQRTKPGCEEPCRAGPLAWSPSSGAGGDWCEDQGPGPPWPEGQGLQTQSRQPATPTAKAETRWEHLES